MELHFSMSTNLLLAICSLLIFELGLQAIVVGYPLLAIGFSFECQENC